MGTQRQEQLGLPPTAPLYKVPIAEADLLGPELFSSAHEQQQRETQARPAGSPRSKGRGNVENKGVASSGSGNETDTDLLILHVINI